jgi:acyl carrier protein
VGVGGLTAGQRGDRAVRGGGGPEIIAELRAVLAEATGRAELAAVGEQVPLFGSGVGLDSLSGTLLLREVHRRFGVDVAGEDLNLDALATLGTLAAFIEERIA